MKCLLVLLLTTTICYAQEYPRGEPDLSQLTDEIFAFQDDEMNYEELQEMIAQLLIHPIDVNLATEEELRFLSVLSEEQIQSLLSYRREQGFLLSIYELQTIPGLDIVTIRKMIPFVRVYDHQSDIRNVFRRLLTEKNNYLIARYERTLESQKGFSDTTENKFTGSADKMYLRFRVSRPHDFSVGFSAEKDAGERLMWDPKEKQLGFDFWSGHAQVQNKGKLVNIIVGDFQSQFGQGLILGGAFGTGKGAETIMSVRRNNIGFVPYTSSNESLFNRGISTTWKVQKHFFISGFYSSLNQDASLTTDSITISAGSIQASGLHRTRNEIENENKVHEQQIGGVISVRKRSFESGLIYHQVQYDVALERSATVYNQFDFRGASLRNVGVFTNWSMANFTFFSEAAHTIGQGSAVVAGTIGSLGRNVDISLLYRNYARNFHSFNANAFAESSAAQNERGAYWGLKYRLSRKYNIASYVDLFRFPWLRFRSYSPSNGHEFLIRFNYQPSKHILMFAQFREEQKQRNTSTDEQLYSTVNATKRNYLLSADYTISENLRMKTRGQYSTFKSTKQLSDGLVITQDISFTYHRLQLTARYALFHTDDFDNRQYVYENDVWLAYSLPAYNGRGVRNYMVIEFKASKRLTLWARWSSTRYADQEKIGSGVDEITGNRRNDVKFQARIRL
jgi:hypothetical protein